MVRNSVTLPLKKNNIINDLNENKQSNKISNLKNNPNENKDKIENKDVISSNKNRLMYEKIKKKLNFNNTHSNNIYNNYINMKISKDNYNKNSNNFNKTFTSSNTNKTLQNNLNLNNTSVKKRKSDKKLSQYAAKINNYYNKHTLNNSDIKGFSLKNTKNIDASNKNRSSILENGKYFNFNKYMITGNKYQSLYKSKKENNNKMTITSQLNNSLSLNRNNYNPSFTERIRANSINTRNSFDKKSNKLLDNVISSYSAIQIKKEKILNIFKENKKIPSKEESYYILSISPILRLSEQLIFSRASKNIRKVLPIDTVLNNHNIFLNIKAKELINEINLCDKRIKTPFSASKIADITLNFITSLDEQEFKDFDILETNKEIVNIYYTYIKLFYYLFNINYDNNLDGKKMKNNLYEKVKEKGFRHLRDYLYHIYIAKKQDINIVNKIEIINSEIINNYPDILNIQESIKICRFTAFANYLIKEIIKYANNIKDTCELKFRAQYLLEIVMGKIEKMQNKSNKLKQIKKIS